MRGSLLFFQIDVIFNSESAQLKLKDRHIDESFNYYRLALAKSLTRGRRAEQVYASCVYLSCRTSQPSTEHMLLAIVRKYIIEIQGMTVRPEKSLYLKCDLLVTFWQSGF